MALWVSGLFMWALFAYSLRPWLLLIHLPWLWVMTGEKLAAPWLCRAYVLLLGLNLLGLCSMLLALSPITLLGPLLLVAGLMLWLKPSAPPWPLALVVLGGLLNTLARPLNLFVLDSAVLVLLAWVFWPRVLARIPKAAPAGFSLGVGLLALSRLWVFYQGVMPFTAPRVNAQPGVTVMLPMASHPGLGQNPRFVLESCDRRHWWVGTAFSPLLTRYDKKFQQAKSVLRGKATDLAFEDCQRGLMLVGDNQHHRLYVLDNHTLATLYQSPDLKAQVSYMAADPARQRVFFGEDVGFKTWRLDYANPRRPRLDTFNIPSYDLLYHQGVLFVASKGALLRLDPEDMTVLNRRPLTVPLQPQLFLEATTGTLYVTDILGGRVLVYDAETLAPRDIYWTGPGVRYAWVDAVAGKLITLNYFSGYLDVRSLSTHRLEQRLFVGGKGRAITTTRDGRFLLMVTNVGLISVEPFYKRMKVRL